MEQELPPFDEYRKRSFKVQNGLLTTIAWGLNGEVTYALEGSIFIAGAGIQWLRDELRLLYDASLSEQYANLVDDTDGSLYCSRFYGLGAPYWDMNAKGAIFGLTRGTKREHIIRVMPRINSLSMCRCI